MSRPLKATALICVLCLLLTVPAFAASWTVLNPADYVHQTQRDDNDIVTVSYDFGTSPLIEYKVRNVDGGQLTGSASNSVLLDLAHGSSRLPAYFDVYPLGVKANPGYALSRSYSGGIAIDARDLKPNAAVEVWSNISIILEYAYNSVVGGVTPDFTHVTAEVEFYGYDANGGWVGGISDSFSQVYALKPEASPLDVQIFKTLYFSEFAESVRYIVPCFRVVVTMPEDKADVELINIGFTMPSFHIMTRTDMLLQDSLTMQRIENQLEDLNDKQDQTNEKLDQIIQQPEQEKQEASGAGGDAADQLAGAIPDQSQGFMTAIQDLAAAMSYDGTEAKLTFPSIRLPEIPGVMKSYKLSDEQEVDFGFWIQKMPDKLLTLVQVLATLALVVYSFKELYGMISYAMTLKGGSTDV